MRSKCRLQYGGSAPATPGFNAVAPEWLDYGAALAAPAIPAAESTLGSHPCVALILRSGASRVDYVNPPINAFAANGDKPLNFVSHSRGSLRLLATPINPLRDRSGLRHFRAYYALC
jgi:hypothetical protein